MVIKRYDLDYILLKKAIKLGAHFSKQHVIDIEENEHSIQIHTKETCIQTKYAIIATGANIGLLRKLKDPGLIYHFSDHVSKKLNQKYTGYRLAEKWLNKTWLVNFSIDQGNKSTAIKNRMVDILEERLDFSKYLTWKKIIVKIHRLILSQLVQTLSRKIKR